MGTKRVRLEGSLFRPLSIEQLVINSQMEELDDIEASNESLRSANQQLQQKVELLQKKKRLVRQVFLSIDCFVDNNVDDEIREKIKKLSECYWSIINTTKVEDLDVIESEISSIFFH